MTAVHITVLAWLIDTVLKPSLVTRGGDYSTGGGASRIDYSMNIAITQPQLVHTTTERNALTLLTTLAVV